MIRSIIWYFYFFLSLILTIPGMIQVKYLDKKGREAERVACIQKWTKRWAKSLLKIAGVKVTVHGEENLPKDRTVLFVGNHQGNFDIPLYLSSLNTPLGFISKVEVKKIPFVRTWMTYMHCVFMDRSNLRASSKSIIEGINYLKSGYNLSIFPEGTRSRGDDMAEFKAGSFKLATKSKCPIVPITIDGSYKIMEQSKPSWIIKPANVNIFIHKPVETADLTKEELLELPEKVQNIVASKLPK